MAIRLMIRRRRLWAAVAAVVVGLGTVAVAALLSVWLLRAAERNAFARADLAADVAMQQGLHTVSTIDGLLAQVQLCRRLRIDGENDAAATVEAQLRNSIRTSGIGVIDVAIGDAAGTVQWSAMDLQAAGSIAGEPYLSSLLDGAHGLQVSGVVIDTGARRSVLRFIRPLLDAPGTFAGFAMVVVDPSLLSAPLAALHLDIAAVPLLARLQDGAVIAHAGGLVPADAASPMLDAAMLAQIRTNGAGNARLASPLSGRDSFVGYHTLGAGALVVLAELDAAKQMAPARSQARLIQLAAGVVVLLCAAALAGYLVLLHRRDAREALAAARLRIAAAEAARAELEALLAGLPVAAYQGRLSPDGEYTRCYLSRNIAKITGWAPADLEQPADWEEHIDGAEPGSIAAFYRNVLHDGSGSMEYRLRRPDSGVTWLSECARIAVRLPDGGAEVVGTIADVTAERELAAQAAMTSKLSMLGEMASGMAHELTQPLTAITIGAELATLVLQRQPTDVEAITRTLETITTQSRRAGEIIHQLRLFGRADQGPPGPVRLEDAVHGALTLVAGLLRDAAIQSRIELDPEMPPVLGRLAPIEQVLVNLCMNARDALLTRPTGARRLSISAAAEGNSVRVRVADTGGGLSPAVLARLFEPFVTTKPAGVGTGLGLSICLRLMRGFGGDIAARNTEVGAEFLLTFRVATAESATTVSRDRAE